MQRIRLFYCPRAFPYRKHCLLVIFIVFSPFIFVFLKTKYEICSDFLQTSYLLSKQKVLVPVGIDHLYDYRVVCKDEVGSLDRTNLINQLSKTCRVNLSGKLNITLNPPKNFEIRSFKKPTNMKSCSLYDNEITAIIMTYRDRKENLYTLLYNLIPLLQAQQISNYKIFIVEQQATGAFNKGRLYNIAFDHVMKTYKPNCIIFHDVDLIPENNQNLYSCVRLTDHPLHMSANIRVDRTNKYTTIYPFLVGGVLAMRPKTFELLNGYSNIYFNWGGEDDDMGLRFLAKDMCVQRPTTGYYYARSHSRQTRNQNRFKFLFDAVLRQDIDGLTNIKQLATITKTVEYSLVTWLTVDWIDQ